MAFLEINTNMQTLAPGTKQGKVDKREASKVKHGKSHDCGFKIRLTMCSVCF